MTEKNLPTCGQSRFGCWVCTMVEKDKSMEAMISNDDELKNIIKEIIDNNPQSVIDYKAGKDRAVGFLMGQLMKKTQGKVNPKTANELIVEELKNR